MRCIQLAEFIMSQAASCIHEQTIATVEMCGKGTLKEELHGCRWSVRLETKEDRYDPVIPAAHTSVQIQGRDEGAEGKRKNQGLVLDF